MKLFFQLGELFRGEVRPSVSQVGAEMAILCHFVVRVVSCETRSAFSVNSALSSLLRAIHDKAASACLARVHSFATVNLIRCQAKFLTSRHVRMHSVIFCISNTLSKLLIWVWCLRKCVGLGFGLGLEKET